MVKKFRCITYYVYDDDPSGESVAFLKVATEGAKKMYKQTEHRYGDYDLLPPEESKALERFLREHADKHGEEPVPARFGRFRIVPEVREWEEGEGRLPVL